jgi:transcriptional regulator with PAS, ATPase and Fis domain
VHRALLLSRGNVIEPCDLPLDLAHYQKSASMRLEDVELEHILRVLDASAGQLGKSAELLGIDPKTIWTDTLFQILAALILYNGSLTLCCMRCYYPACFGA